MGNATDFLVGFRRIFKLHESMLKDICQAYSLTLTEAAVISFLYNNPGLDTAADIVELRMLQKGNVSQAVEQLCRKSLLERNPDGRDRRKIHLALTPEAAPIVHEIGLMCDQFHAEVVAGLSGEEWEQFTEVNRKMQENIRNAMARRNEK